MKKQIKSSTVSLVFLSLLLVVGLVIGVWLGQQSQDIRQQASGQQCYLAIRSTPGQLVGIIEAPEGIQTIDGQRYCVGGAGERYRDYYLSRERGLDDLGDPPYPCQAATVNLDGYRFSVGDSCSITDSISGKVVCVGGPEIEVWGCINNQSGNHYRSLGERSVSSSSPTNFPVPTLSPTPTLTSTPTLTPTPTPEEICTMPGPSYVRASLEMNDRPVIRVAWPNDDQVDSYQLAICRKSIELAEGYTCEIVVNPNFNLDSSRMMREYLDHNIKCGYEYMYQIGTVKSQEGRQCYGVSSSNMVEVNCQESPEPPTCNSSADLNCDGKLDLVDYELFLRQFRLFH